MPNKCRLYKTYHFITISLLLLAACSSTLSNGQSGTAISQTQITSVGTYTSQLLSPSPLQPIPSKTVSITTPSQVITLEPMQILAPPLPTKALPDEAMAFSLEMLMNNGGCRFPCWWGVTPGVTNYTTLIQSLAGYAENDYQANEVYDKEIVELWFQLPEKYSGFNPLEIRAYVESGLVQSLHVIRAPENQIFRILGTYGQPGEIWIHTMQFPIGMLPPVVLYLFYPSHGILIKYTSPMSEVSLQANMIKGCFSESYPSFFFWKEGLELTFDNTRGGIETPNDLTKPILPVEDATGMNVEMFYQTFRNPGEKPCIETPADLWPEA